MLKCSKPPPLCHAHDDSSHVLDDLQYRFVARGYVIVEIRNNVFQSLSLKFDNSTRRNSIAVHIRSYFF
ncbi:hypothetical protein GYMLUDRAFT_819791 [Collybiopsis luxurians FD-317 M1]|uniref:Uncharacterized protein n=1 Tax=Collybiopsis luxurians FD-317 M1 TaxID=944289 RepID=A0A0D0C294_9AGAR|nr:hypothetical protein GYMLUDRAFT_819791 [Collybiopsis luxurians FD-317 M1]